MEMTLDKKKIGAIFLLTCDINNTFGLGTPNKQCGGGSVSFVKEMRALQMKNGGAGHQKLTTTNWEPSLKLRTTWEVAEELSIDYSMVIRHLKQTGKVKKLNKWVPHKLTANKKNCLLKVSSSLILRNNKPFLNWIVACDEKVMTSSVAGLRRCSKPLPKANLAPKKGHDHCLLVCCQSDPL